MITRLVLAAAIAAIGVTTVVAQSDPLAQRKAIMKGVGEQSRVARDMLDGKTPFNADAAKKVFATFEDAAGKMPALFPDNSKTAAAQVKDLDSFKAQMGEVGKNCGGCHQTYRKRQS